MKKSKVALLGIAVGCMVCFATGCTASTKRKLVDIQSNWAGGLQRTITVYTADGQKLASYHGKIDIESNDGGYVKFDLDGKRYIYYNCFVESIADID